MKYNIPLPPRDIYECPTPNRVYQEDQHTYLIEKIEYGGGIKTYYKGAEYPMFGFPTIEAINAINKVKRLIINTLKHFNVLLIFVGRKRLIKWFNEISYEFIHPFILKDEYLTRPAREIKRILYPIDKTMAVIIAHLVEYDAAYRYRLQDMCSEMDEFAFYDNPRMEIYRCLKIGKERDHKDIHKKYALLFNLLFWFSNTKKVLQTINLDELKLSHEDRYWVCFRSDYNFMGMTYEERQRLLKKKKYKIPQQYLVKFQ